MTSRRSRLGAAAAARDASIETHAAHPAVIASAVIAGADRRCVPRSRQRRMRDTARPGYTASEDLNQRGAMWNAGVAMRDAEVIENELMEISAIADDTLKFDRIVAWCAAHPGEVAFVLHQYMSRHPKQAPPAPDPNGGHGS